MITHKGHIGMSFYRKENIMEIRISDENYRILLVLKIPSSDFAALCNACGSNDCEINNYLMQELNAINKTI